MQVITIVWFILSVSANDIFPILSKNEVNARYHGYSIDFGRGSLPYMGIGGLSGGGGTSRLLFDYSEPQRSEILDALFLPNHGASIQILKVEIGGDAQSTEATEASHMHTRDDGKLDCEICYNRGYEWWLLKEAKKRNPNIKTYGLSWGVPGWIGDNITDPHKRYWSEDNIDYHVKWAAGLKKFHNIQLDYIGIWNEKSPVTGGLDWIVRLRYALDQEPSGIGKKVQIVAADTRWDICSPLAANKTVNDAVAIIGVHYPINDIPQDKPTPPECLTLGKPLWTSEGWSLRPRNDWTGAMNLAATLNKNWVMNRQQAMIVWTIIYSWYSILPYKQHGLMTAIEPWGGYYHVMPPVYAVAHHTQFVASDGSCLYVENHAVAIKGIMGNGTTAVAYTCGKGKSVSLVIETTGATQNQSVVLTMKNLPQRTSMLHVWRTTETQLFHQLEDVQVSENRVTLTLEPHAIYTLTTTTGQHAVQNTTKIPPHKLFPVNYSDDFDSYTDQAVVKYFTDEGGSWNAAAAPGRDGMALMQVVMTRPIQWGRDPDPFSLVGDAQTTNWRNYSGWGNYSVTIDALVGNVSNPESGIYTQVCGRVQRYDRGGKPVMGYCLLRNETAQTWSLLVAGVPLISGHLSSTNDTGGWHSLSLKFSGTSITALLDSKKLATVKSANFSRGMVAVGSGWHQAYFDNFQVSN